MSTNRIKQLREARRLSQEKLAETLGIKFATVSRHESGSRGFTKEQAEAYAKALGVTMVELYVEPGSLFSIQDERELVEAG